MSRLLFSVLAASFALGAQAVLVATFDSFQEGEVFDTFTDGGITFSNVTRHQGGYTNFAIEDASATLSGAGFTPPNTLDFGGYSPGGGAAFGAFGGMTFTATSEANTASLDLWTLPLDMGGNTLTLIGYKNGTVIDMDAQTFGNSYVPIHMHFQLQSDTYDVFRLESSGPAVSGDSFIVVDTVVVDAVPEPATWLALGAALAAIARRRR